MEGKIATTLGMLLGYITNLATGNLFTSVLVAFCTGAAAYLGQQVIKYVHQKLKNAKRRT